MDKGQKILTTILWGVLVLVMLGVVGTGLWARRLDKAPAAELPMLWDAPPFSLTDQNDKPFGNAELHGHPWVAAFIFTHCAGSCPMMTMKMSDLQKAVPDARVKLVSFTVDPQRDTPAVLKEYAARFGADESRWHFLTGEQKAIFDVAAGMKLTAMPTDDQNVILHDERFLLFDGRGRLRGIYHSKDDDSMKKLATDATGLAAETADGGRAP